MGKIKKKGVAGNAKNFITRTQAVRKLQISLPDFRRLCIFKGIYPREPRNKKKANKGSTAPVTFYYTKDIQYLLHEPVLQKFREHKTFSKKLSKALGRGDFSDAKRLETLHKPRIKLDHIIKERYPAFTDAVRDLDDALSTVFLFANLPSNRDIPAKTIETCARLANEFQHYVIRKRAMRKSFLSIKGIYYQAEIQGQEVLWLVPYKFAQNVPQDVDFRIMLTFLDFYTTLLGFVLFRLYTIEGLVYPPKFDKGMDDKGAGLRAFMLESKKVGQQLENGEAVNGSEVVKKKDVSKQLETLGDKIKEIEEEGDDEKAQDVVAAEGDEAVNEGLDTFTAIPSKDGSTDVLQQPQANGESGKVSNMFSDWTVYLSRETPRDPLEFLLRSFGCKRLGWDAVLGEGSFTTDDTDPSITHQIVDRPPMVGLPPVPAAAKDGDTDMGNTQPKQKGRVLGRIYVQPQYIWDCVNAGRVLRPDAYAQGAELPPHLSPWVKAKEGEYDPTAPVVDDGESEEEEVEVEDVKMITNGENGVASEDDDEEEDEDDEEEDEESGGMKTELAGEGDDSEEEEDSEDNEIEEVDLGDSEEDQLVDEDDEAAEQLLQHQRELEAEASGVTYTSNGDKKKSKQSEAKKKLEKQKKEKAEEIERQKMMMTKKKRKLYERMEYGNKKKQEEKERLEGKRRKIEKEKRKAKH